MGNLRPYRFTLNCLDFYYSENPSSTMWQNCMGHCITWGIWNNNSPSSVITFILQTANSSHSPHSHTISQSLWTHQLFERVFLTLSLADNVRWQWISLLSGLPMTREPTTVIGGRGASGNYRNPLKMKMFYLRCFKITFRCLKSHQRCPINYQMFWLV